MSRRIVALTGAGISAESGIPTFRGPDGFWTIGSKNYQPEELATRRAFVNSPREIWAWYLSRLHASRHAQPNAGHVALARLAQALGPERFALITQNVDGLHSASGVRGSCLYEIHGNIRRMRCFRECEDSLQPLPTGIDAGEGAVVSDEEWEKLQCGRCGGPMRPHVLWFDEYYEERHYRSESAMQAMEKLKLLLVIGTSGSTTLPAMMVDHALRTGSTVWEINIERSAFTRDIEASPGGRFIQEASARALPELVEHLLEVSHFY